MNYMGLFAGGIVLFCSVIYVWSIFYGEKIKFSNLYLYISIFVLTILSILNRLYINVFVNMIIITFLMAICNWFLFRKKINCVIISTLYGQFIATLSDSLYMLVCMFIFKGDSVFVKNNFFNTFIANVIVSIIYVAIASIPIVKKLYLKISDFTYRIRIKYLILSCTFLIISFNFLGAISYYNMKSIYAFIINILLIIIYSFVFYVSMNERNVNFMVKAENKSLMESLHQYEDMVDRQRVDNHENKNQLLIIKNMVKKNDKDVIKYIDAVVKDEKEDDEALYTKVKSIPSGGLQGIIYQKMLSMKDNRILFSLDVSRDVRKIDLERMNIEDNYKLCKIVGVLLDNAIEESLKIDDKRVMISLYVDDNMLVIDISNRFDGNIDLDRIDDEGYTTKGDGHGYGLALVKKLVNGSSNFVNERRINKDIFKQIIKFKLK